MLSIDLFATQFERDLREGAVDDLEHRRIDALNDRMQDLVNRARNASPEIKAVLKREFDKVKDERDSYYKVREAGIPGNVPVEKIPGKEDLLKGRGRSYYEGQKKNNKQVDEYISMGSDKNFTEAEPYKNYRIYVRRKPFGATGMYTAHTEIDRKEFKEPGASQEEAVQAIRDRIDFVLNAQRKVTGSSTIDFNVKFATDLLADPRQTFYAKLENINGEPKLIIASADVASDPELLAAGDFKRSALRNQVDDSGRATPLPGIPLTAKGLRSGDWIANGRYTVGKETQDRDGNRVFDLTYHSTVHTKSDHLRLNQPAFTLGTAREVDEHGGGVGPRQHWQDLMQETVVDVKAGMAEIYRKLAPRIERHRDSFLAGQLYDELENYAELHGAEGEFKRMMNGARNRAHMEYDTNPGGFQNWFWFLPFEDENVAEGFEYASKVQHPKYGSGQVVKVYSNGMITVNFPNYPDPIDKKPGIQGNFMPGDSNYQSLKSGMAEGTDDIKKRMSKLEALALAANRAGDDTKCKMYQQKIQVLKQKLSQSMLESAKPGEYYIHTVYFKDGTKKRIRVTSDEVDVADYYNKRGQAVDRVDYDYQIHSDMTEAEKEPTTRQELLDRLDKIQRMMTQDRNPANLQILRKELEMLKQRYQHLREDSDGGEAVEMAIMRRMLVAHTDLIVEHGLDKVVDAIEEVAYNVGEVDEIGTSDVSGWVHQVKQILGAVA